MDGSLDPDRRGGSLGPPRRLGRKDPRQAGPGFREAAGSDLGRQAMLNAAKSLAMTTIDLLSEPEHLKRDAYLYIRQSTPRQVLENAESGKRQYALRQRAIALG